MVRPNLADVLELTILLVGEPGMGPVNNNVSHAINSTVTSEHGSVIHNLSTAIHMPDWLLGAIGGAVFTQLLMVAWDFFKRSMERRNRERIFLLTILQDVIKSKETAANIRNVLQEELTFVDNNQSVVPPIEMIYSGIHDFLKMDIPKSLMTKELLSLVRDISRMILHVNETIRSRERWRIHNQNFNNFSRRLKMYDEFLLNLLSELDERLDKLTGLITVKEKVKTDSSIMVPQSEVQV